MYQRIRNFLSIPGPLREAYRDAAVRHNRLSLLVINGMIVGMELFNMLRVLLWSASGLSTWNNRVYFAMYATLFAAAIVSLFLQRTVRRRQWAAQYVSSVAYLLWHVGLNAYDLYRDPAAEISVYMTAVLGLAVFIRMPAAYSIPAYAAAYALFLSLTAGTLRGGDLINLTITTIVSLAVSMTGSHHAVIHLTQQQEIWQINRQLRQLLRRDPLTGLLNRAAFEETVRACLARGGGSITLLMMDLDDFKGVNDRFGHPCGDYVLQETAVRLQAAFPAAAGIGRIGGDEFSVVMAGGVERADVEQAGQWLLRELPRINWRDQVMEIQCSIGICRAGGVSYEQLYQQADAALYAAKRRGKGRIHWSAPEPPDNARGS